MSDLTIEVIGSQPDIYAAAPTLLLKLRITRPGDEPVHAMVLKAQIRIEPQLRHYSPEEEMKLRELFGDAPRWGQTAKPFVWTHVSTALSEFKGSVEVDLPVPCSYDFEVGAAKYLHGIGDGEVPIVLLFNGTIFGYREGADRQSRLMVQPISWNVEANYRLPIKVWRGSMDAFFPNSGWIRLHTDTIDALTRYRADRALVSWEDTFELLLKEAGSE